MRPARRLLAQAIAENTLTLSAQVLQEFYNVTQRRRLMDPRDAVRLMQVWAECDVVNATPQMLFRAFDLHQRRRLSVWDALVVQAALDAGCTTLYSEDLQHGVRFEALEVVDPFRSAPAVQEPAAAYAGKRRRR